MSLSNLDYLDPFVLPAITFGYTTDSIVDMELQPFYDGSVNIITVSEGTKPRIVNSRQRFIPGDEVELVVRKADNFDNVYSDTTIEKTLLIPELSEVVPVLSFTGVIPDSGRLQNGGYKYFFRFKTADGTESATFEESRLVSVHSGNEFGKSTSYIDGTITRNSVQFDITNIDTRVYKYVSVYYVLATGQVQPTAKTAYHIDKDYEIIEGATAGIGYCEIAHTGFESKTVINIADITVGYSPIDSAVTLTQKNNRLLLGNLVTTNTSDDLLRKAALKCYIVRHPKLTLSVTQKIDGDTDTVDNSYANPSYIYNNLGYFPGETYEFAINFVFKNGTVSESYPIMGMDYSYSLQTFDPNLDPDTFVNGWDGYQNSLGIVRMFDPEFTSIVSNSGTVGKPLSEIINYTMGIHTVNMVNTYATELQALGVISYFVTRKKRVPDLLMEGLLTLAATASISSMYPTELNMYIFGNYAGYGLEKGSLGDNIVLFPLPGSALPVSAESLYYKDTDSTRKSYTFFDGVLYAPLASVDKNKYYAFYSPDITCDTARTAVISTKNNYGLSPLATITQSILYKSLNIVRTYSPAAPVTIVSNRYPYAANSYTALSKGSLDPNYPIQYINYIDDGYRSFKSLGFTGRLDRQTALALYSELRSFASYGYFIVNTDKCAGLFRSSQTSFATVNLNVADNKDLLYSAHPLTAVSVSSCNTKFPETPENPYCQIPMTSVKYSPYLGITADNVLSIALSITDSANNRWFSGYSTESEMVPGDGLTRLGIISRIYNNADGKLTPTNWKEFYSIERPDPYFAISNRYAINYGLNSETGNTGFLTGGDCYAGFYFQRVWRPGGIDGVPTANNPRNYASTTEGTTETVTRQGTGITNSGYAIGFPVRSAYNFALRAEYNADELETELYGGPRTYTSSALDKPIHGNRQAETSVINYGNILEESVMQYPAFDSSIPYIELKYDNRVIVSDISVVGEFENGYRDFKGLNFKDYDNELGKITALVSNGLFTYIVYNNGVSMVEVLERAAITNENSNTNVYIAASDVLPPKTTPVFSTVGSQHLKSIVAIENGVYGVDASARKIWGIIGSEKQVISDSVIQSLLNRLITSDLENIISSFDVQYNEITFNFIYNDGTQKSLLYNTKFNLWYGTTDIHKLYQFNVEDRVMSIQRPEFSSVYSLYYPVTNINRRPEYKAVGKALAIDDLTMEEKETYSAYIEFVVKTEQLQEFSLSNLIINGNGIPSKIDIIGESTDEYQVLSSPTSVTGVDSVTIPAHTNIYMLDTNTPADLNSGNDDFTIIRSSNVNSKTLSIGDEITLLIGTIYQQCIIANLSKDGSGNDVIILDREKLPGTLNALYYGWKTPIRVSTSEIGGGRVDITIPTRRHAELLAGNTTNSKQYHHVNYANAKPYGRWVRLRLHFEGINQIYIDSVMSEIVLRYS